MSSSRSSGLQRRGIEDSLRTGLLPTANAPRRPRSGSPNRRRSACPAQFFFQIEQERQSFALYTEATKFIRHRDGMVRRRLHLRRCHCVLQ